MVFDISPEGQRWFQFRLLHSGPQGLRLDDRPVSVGGVCGT